MSSKMYPYGLIGNCQISALISESGAVEWLCLPRPDSAPIFGKLLDPDGGVFSIEGNGTYVGRQEYLTNTNVLVTTLSDKDGNSFRITDFCPRFYQNGRIYRPSSLFRIVEAVSGRPMIKVKCAPVTGWEKEKVHPVRGNSELRFDYQNEYLRLETNMPLTYLSEGTEFALKEKLYFGLSWSFSFEKDLVSMTESFLVETLSYWDTWVKHCSIPSLYQRETIRSALTLKLHCYEDTGAILAGLTTSLPEDEIAGRNWDYRYCWLRDSYFVLNAFHNLGHFEEMEGFIKFLLNIAEKHEHSREKLRPVYRLDQSLPLPELEHKNWHGYFGIKPVRSNNQAAEQLQNDVYGEMVLLLSPIFLDERFHHLRSQEHENLLAHLAKLCIQNISKPDAGLWELRNGWQEHSFSNLMCWAGIDRIQKVCENGFLKSSKLNLVEAKATVESALRACVRDGSLRNGPKDDSFDAALLLIAPLRFPDLNLWRSSVQKIHEELRLGKNGSESSFLYRYLRDDDFGRPQSAFVICSFWLVEALAKIGKKDEALKVMKDAMSAAGALGLFSEHFLVKEQKQSGNFPQAYSHVGQINAAFAISPPWSEIL